MYHSPSRTNDELEAFCNKLQNTLDQIKDAKLQCTILTGDLTWRSTQF